MSDHAELNPTEVLHRLGLTEEMVRAHVMRPDHVMNATLGFDLRRPADATDDPSNPPPPSGLLYRLNTDKLRRDLHGLLSFCLAGYSMQLRRYGRVVFDDQWNWSKTPVDGEVSWDGGSPDARRERKQADHCDGDDEAAGGPQHLAGCPDLAMAAAVLGPRSGGEPTHLSASIR